MTLLIFSGESRAVWVAEMRFAPVRRKLALASWWIERFLFGAGNAEVADDGFAAVWHEEPDDASNEFTDAEYQGAG